MKRLIYQVYVGKQSHLYNHCTNAMHWYCKAHGIDHVVQREPILRIKPDVFATGRSKESYEKHGGFLPIFEKENAFNYFKEYDQIAIVDSDIWVRPDAPNLFEELTDEYDFAGMVESSAPILEWYRKKIINYSRMQYGSIKLPWKYDNNSGFPFMNMGLMLMNKGFAKHLKGQTPAQFIGRPEFKQFVDGVGPWKWSTDQTLLNTWIQNENIPTKKLSWKWNALFTALPDQRIKEAHFVHFFLKDKLPNRGENVTELMERVK